MQFYGAERSVVNGVVEKILRKKLYQGINNIANQNDVLKLLDKLNILAALTPLPSQEYLPFRLQLNINLNSSELTWKYMKSSLPEDQTCYDPRETAQKWLVEILIYIFSNKCFIQRKCLRFFNHVTRKKDVNFSVLIGF